MTKTGTVKWFSESKGWGFIAPDDGGRDLFAQASQIRDNDRRSLAENQRVQFDVVESQERPQAWQTRMAWNIRMA